MGLGEAEGDAPLGARSLDDGEAEGKPVAWRAVWDFHPPQEGRTLDSRLHELGGPCGIRTHDSRIKSPELYR